MGPSLGILIRDWPPLQLPSLKQALARRAATFFVRPADHTAAEMWHLEISGDADAPAISIHVGAYTTDYVEAKQALGWKPQGYVELYGFKQTDLKPTVCLMAELASLIAERLGGVVLLDDETYVTGAEYRKLSELPEFAISGYRAS